MDVCVEAARLEFPENQQAPIAASLALRTEGGVAIGAEFDFRQKGEQSWDIELTATSGRIKLSRGGAGEQQARDIPPLQHRAGGDDGHDEKGDANHRHGEIQEQRAHRRLVPPP